MEGMLGSGDVLRIWGLGFGVEEEGEGLEVGGGGVLAESVALIDDAMELLMLWYHDKIQSLLKKE